MERRVRTAITVTALSAIGGVLVGFAPPARAALEAIMSCTSSAPCLEWDNSGGGDAVKGVSSKGNALHGQTKYKSAGKTSGKAGVFGEDLSTAGNLDSGVSGVSTNGAGVTGTSSNYNGVQGLSANSTGVYGQTAIAAGYGVAGRNISSTHDNNGAGVLADGNAATDGLHAFAYGVTANAIYAYSQYGSALVLNQGPNAGAPALSIDPVGPFNYLIESTDSQGSPLFSVFGDGGLAVDAENGTAGTFRVVRGLDIPVLFLQAGTAGTNHDAFELYDTNGFDQTRITDAGNIYAAGHIFTSGSCNSGCIVNDKQVRRVAEYTPAEAEPTVEDNGEADLADGRADVALDPKFANVIERNSDYLVTVTPEGDCRGLYVTNRTMNGFTVRELQGGHTNVGFAYRIVAHRFGDHAERLPMMGVKHASEPRRPARRQSPSSR